MRDAIFLFVLLVTTVTSTLPPIANSQIKQAVHISAVSPPNTMQQQTDFSEVLLHLPHIAPCLVTVGEHPINHFIRLCLLSGASWLSGLQDTALLFSAGSGGMAAGLKT